MRWWRRLRRGPLATPRNVVFLVLVVAVLAITFGAFLVFGAFLDRFGT